MISLLELAKEYDYVCQYCMYTFPIQQLSRDHIIPKIKGGTDDRENITLACRPCNTRKSAQIVPQGTVPEYDTSLKKQPKRKTWDDYDISFASLEPKACSCGKVGPHHPHCDLLAGDPRFW